jgi:hypothetical protein
VHYPQILAQNENILGELTNRQQSVSREIKTIAFTQTVKFDENLRYLVCYGGLQMLIVDLINNKSYH